MYYVLYFIVIIGAIREIISGKRNSSFFNFCFTIATLMAVLRYGQGTDYFNYQDIYTQTGNELNIDFLASLTVTDPAFCLLCDIGHILGLPYSVFVMFISLLMMALFYKFLSKTCNYSMLSLLVFISLIYMIYVYNMMRQGLAMSFFYGLLYPLLIKNKNVQYYIGSFLIGFIHASSWLFFLFPILKNIKLNNHYLLFFIISIVIMFVSSSILDYIPIPFIKARIEYYTGESSDNAILAKLFRMIVLIPFVLLQNDNIHNENIKISSKFMLYAFFFYSIFAFSELTASRIWGLFLGFECLFLANISFAIRKSAKRLKLLAFFSVLLIIMWFKDIGAAINQGEYRHCNMFTYPYFSIMEEEDDLDYYRGNKQI